MAGVAAYDVSDYLTGGVSRVPLFGRRRITCPIIWPPNGIERTTVSEAPESGVQLRVCIIVPPSQCPVCDTLSESWLSTPFTQSRRSSRPRQNIRVASRRARHIEHMPRLAISASGLPSRCQVTSKSRPSHGPGDPSGPAPEACWKGSGPGAAGSARTAQRHVGHHVGDCVAAVT